MTTSPTFRAEFKPGEGGKTAVYMARWINTRPTRGRGAVVGDLDGDGGGMRGDSGGVLCLAPMWVLES